VPELRWQQALPLDCGADPFGSAFCTRSFPPENLAGKVWRALALQHGIPRPRDPLLPARHSLPFLLDQSLLKVPVFERIYQVANTTPTLLCLQARKEVFLGLEGLVFERMIQVANTGNCVPHQPGGRPPQ
jgi:hypothetical protein